MKFAEAFRETIFRYNLTGNKLAAESGLTQMQISKFRNGGDLRTDSLEKLLEAMPPEARQYMMSLVLSHDHDHVPLPKATIETVGIQQGLQQSVMPPLHAINDRLRVIFC